MNMVKKLVCGVVFAAVALGAASAWAAGTVPSGYTEVACITVTNQEQYIDTGFQPYYMTDVEAHFEVPDFSSQNVLYWTRTSSSFAFITKANTSDPTKTNKVRAYRSSNGSNTVETELPDYLTSTDIFYSTTFVDNRVNNTFTVNGQKVNFVAASGTGRIPNMFLFRLNDNGTLNSSVKAVVGVKLYSFTIFEDGAAVADFVPCVRDADGVAGLYDTVRNSFYTNAAATGGSFGYEELTGITICPIPTQVNETFEPCRPEFVVSNRTSGAMWTVGGDIASPIVDVAYANNYGAGEATVTVTGKGEYAGQRASGSFTITATKLEDDNLVTTDTLARRYEANGKYVYEFKSTASAHTATAKRGLVLSDYLLVGGGGGGGNNRGGGGGAGGVASATGLVGCYIGRNDTFAFAVGAGGAGSASTNNRGDSGGATMFTIGDINLNIPGGGGGGSWNNTAGVTGASGGGGAQDAAGGAGVAGFGFAGATGAGFNSSATGGGGGAGHAGYQANTSTKVAGNGGEGIASSITGEEVYYGGGGGGGGGSNDNYMPGQGGAGGGGNGYMTAGGANGVDGLGGGGGGGGTNSKGGNGGSGVVIFAVVPADFEIDPIPEQKLVSGGCEPLPVVRDGGTLLVKDTDYTVSYTDNDKPGTALMTITGINGYAGKSITISFTVCYFVDSQAATEGDGSVESPFATISNAIEKADAAIAGGAKSMTIYVADGTYPENGLVVTNAIVITGNASDRTAVKIGKSGARVFRVAHADAALKNLTVQNGTVTTSAAANAGGNVRLEAGTVANCVLTGGGKASLTDYKGGNLYISAGSAVDCLMTSPLSGPGMFGANAYIAGGVVSRCILENAPKTSSWTALGSGAYLTGGVIENCLLRGNYAGRGTLYLNSSAAKAVNCTIVNNIPESFQGGGIAGVYVNSTAASVINCVIFDNGGTATSEWGNNNGARFFNCVSTVDNANGVNWTKLTFTNWSSYFKDDEDWMPLLGSPMVDAGDDSRYPSTSSQTDIAGNARISGSHIDIGCSELDQSSFNVVATVASYPSVLKGATVDFVCHAAGAAGAVTYELDFGDGSAHLVTTDFQISRRFDVAGFFTVRVRGREGSGEYGDWVAVSVPICVAETDIYVSPEGNDANAGTAAAPFLTVAHALATLTNVSSSCATDVDGVTVHLAAGTYEENGLPAIGSRVTVEGIASDRNAVKVGKSGARIFCLTDEDAVLRNLTVTNGTVTAADISYAGGNVRLENGTVTNCVLTGGGNSSLTDDKGGNLYIGGGMAVDCLLTSPRTGNGSFGLGAYITGGVVSRCIIENAPKKANSYTPLGAGAYLKGGVIENCLVRGNKAGRGAIYLDAASARAVNCTIVGNTPEGGTGGVYVNNSSALVVNCVIYGNGGTATAEWANKNAARFFSCAFAADAAYSGTASTVLNLTDAAFKNYASGDYRPKREGALVNSGTNDLYSSYATSATDLGGAPRIQGKIIDIGCWEALSAAGFKLLIR